MLVGKVDMDSFIGRIVAGLSEQDGIGFNGHVVFGLENGAASGNRWGILIGNWTVMAGKRTRIRTEQNQKKLYCRNRSR
jgi:hypothetical protein